MTPAGAAVIGEPIDVATALWLLVPTEQPLAPSPQQGHGGGRIRKAQRRGEFFGVCLGPASELSE